MMNERNVEDPSDFQEEFEPAIHNLEREGLWAVRSRKVLPGYRDDANGVVFIVQKT